MNRRTFFSTTAVGIGLSSIPFKLSAAFQRQYTVQQIIDIILEAVKGVPFEGTVDTLKSGSPDTIVKGVVTTMFATIDVIKMAMELNANFIIAHEPTFYNHQDQTNWLESSDTFKFKRDLLQKNAIAIWRFHDYWHTQNLDGVREGLLEDLGWKKFQDKENPRVINLSGQKLSDVINHAKAKLGVKEMRFVGELNDPCNKVLLMPGAAGGRSQITETSRTSPDLVICGEVSEWETAEYVRDARSVGKKISLLVLGHAQSEEPGMRYLVNWLKPKVQPLPVIHIPSGNPFSFK